MRMLATSTNTPVHTTVCERSFVILPLHHRDPASSAPRVTAESSARMRLSQRKLQQHCRSCDK
eukprot:3410544-Pleurochrysis_carterae.AAC.1